MQPKNNLQRAVVELSNKLPEITQEQIRWGEQACFNAYFVRSRKTLYCLECGHKWKNESQMVTSIAGADCPFCRSSLKQVTHYDRRAQVNEYWAILDVVEGVQVVRIMFAQKFMKKGQKTKLFTCEVMQHFIFDDGTNETLSKRVQGLSGYIDLWVLTDELEVRTPSSTTLQRYNMEVYKVYPKRKVLPIFIRNGFNGHFYGLSPRLILLTLIHSRKAETLVKAKQFNLYRYLLKNTRLSGWSDEDHHIRKYWSSIKIAIRNRYIVPYASLWFDYLDLLTEFGKDVRNAHYICPANLIKSHDSLVEKQREGRRKEAEENLLKADALYRKQKSKFFDIKIKTEDIEIVPLKSVQDFIDEGDKLKHCVFVSRYYQKESSLLLSARKNGEPIETIEINLQNLSVSQARGLGNKATDMHDYIVATVSQNMNQIRQRLNG